MEPASDGSREFDDVVLVVMPTHLHNGDVGVSQAAVVLWRVFALVMSTSTSRQGAGDRRRGGTGLV